MLSRPVAAHIALYIVSKSIERSNEVGEHAQISTGNPKIHLTIPRRTTVEETFDGSEK